MKRDATTEGKEMLICRSVDSSIGEKSPRFLIGSGHSPGFHETGLRPGGTSTT
jgi:hypothetical protein